MVAFGMEKCRQFTDTVINHLLCGACYNNSHSILLQIYEWKIMISFHIDLMRLLPPIVLGSGLFRSYSRSMEAKNDFNASLMGFSRFCSLL